MSIINIIPVFNQTYEIWSNFARIEIDTLASVHKQFYTQDRAQVIIDLFKSAWDSNMNNFAFALFCKNKMVGFIRGNENMVYDLFVLPEYKGQGIGSKLLNYSEIINHNYKNFLMLYALSSAKNFYHINDYIEQTEDNILIKSLSVQSDNDYIIPMFNARYKLKELYNIDINLSSYKNPCFVYIKNKTLLGYVYSDNKNIKYEVFDNEMKSDISLKLSDAFNCYKENSHLLNFISFEQARKVNVY